MWGYGECYAPQGLSLIVLRSSVSRGSSLLVYIGMYAVSRISGCVSLSMAQRLGIERLSPAMAIY